MRYNFSATAAHNTLKREKSLPHLRFSANSLTAGYAHYADAVWKTRPPSVLTADADRYFALFVLNEYNRYGIFIYYIYYVYLIINMNFYFNYFSFIGGEGNLIVSVSVSTLAYCLSLKKLTSRRNLLTLSWKSWLFLLARHNSRPAIALGIIQAMSFPEKGWLFLGLVF